MLLVLQLRRKSASCYGRPLVACSCIYCPRWSSYKFTMNVSTPGTSTVNETTIGTSVSLLPAIETNIDWKKRNTLPNPCSTTAVAELSAETVLPIAFDRVDCATLITVSDFPMAFI